MDKVYTIYAKQDVPEELRKRIESIAAESARFPESLRANVARFRYMEKDRIYLDGTGATMRCSIRMP